MKLSESIKNAFQPTYRILFEALEIGIILPMGKILNVGFYLLLITLDIKK